MRKANHISRLDHSRHFAQRDGQGTVPVTKVLTRDFVIKGWVPWREASRGSTQLFVYVVPALKHDEADTGKIISVPSTVDAFLQSRSAVTDVLLQRTQMIE